MPTKNRKMTIVLAVTAILVSTVALAAWGAREIQHNMIVVRVQEAGGTDVAFSVPSALLTTAIRLTPASLFDEHMDELDHLSEILPYLEVAYEELNELPDCQLVLVSSADERVRIDKEGNRLVVEVDSADEHVYVAFPIRMISSVVAKLEAIERRI